MSKRGTKTDEPGIYRLDDGRFRVLATAKNPDKGKLDRRQKTLAKEKTLEDAIETRDRLKKEIRTPKAATTRAIHSVADYTEQWVKRKVKKVKPKTARTYADTLEDKVLPAEIPAGDDTIMLGRIPLNAFTRDHVKEWIAWAERLDKDDDGTSYATSTLRKWWRVFRSVIKDMAANGTIPRDYSKKLDPPTTDRQNVREESGLMLDQMHAIHDTSKEVTPERHAEVATLVHTGMRTGELWALHWSDLDFQEETIVIRRSVSDGEVTPTTKSDRSREVPMFAPVADAIRDHRERMMREQPVGFRETELVFPSNVGKPRHPGSLRKAFRAIADAIPDFDRKITAQLIRKSVVTVLRDRDVPSMAIKDMVGHSDDRIQEHYYSATSESRALASVLVKGGETG